MCRSRIIEIGAVFVLIGMIPQPVFGSNTCDILDKVAISSKENIPFSSITHLSLPRGACNVYGDWDDSTAGKSIRSFKCVWSFPKIWEQYYKIEGQIEETNGKKHKAFRAYFNADNELSDLDLELDRMQYKYDKRATEYNRFVRELNDILREKPYVQNHPQFRKAYRSAQDGKRRLDAMKRNIEEMEQELEEKKGRLDTLEVEKNRLEEDENRLEEEQNYLKTKAEAKVASQAKLLLDSIRNCLNSGKIHGHWKALKKEKDKIWIIEREDRDCPYSRCEIRVEAADEVIFSTLVAK